MQTKAIITLAEAKSVCNIRESNTDKDEILGHLTLVATEQLERATGRFFTKQSTVEYFSTRDTTDFGYDDSGWSYTGRVTRIRESRFNLRGVEIDPATLDIRYDLDRAWGDDTKLAEKDYYVDEAAGSLVILSATRKANRSLRVTYSAGYDAFPDEGVTDPDDQSHPLTLSLSAPAYLREACMLQVAYLNTRRRSDNIGMVGDRSHGKADQYVQTLAWGSKMGLAPEVNGLVGHLRRIVMGRY